VHARVLGRDEATVYQPGLRLRFRDRAHHNHLVSVGDNDPLDRVAVVRRTTQHGATRVHPDDAHQGVGTGGDVTDDGHLVTDHDAAPAQLTGPHRDDDVSVVEQAAVTTPVNGDDAGLACLGMRGA